MVRAAHINALAATCAGRKRRTAAAGAAVA